MFAFACFLRCSSLFICVWCLRGKLWRPNKMFFKAKKQQWWWIRRLHSMDRLTQPRVLQCKEALTSRDSRHLLTLWWIRLASKAAFLSKGCIPEPAWWDRGQTPRSSWGCNFSRGCRANRWARLLCACPGSQWLSGCILQNSGLSLLTKGIPFAFTCV